MTNKTTLREKFILPGIGEVVLSGARPLIGILMALIVAAILIAFAGANPFIAYGSLIQGAIGSRVSIANTLVRASPLLLGGVGAAIGIKAGIWNVGIEGQMYLGALGATTVALIPLGVPSWLHITLAILAAAVCGALWGLIPAYLRAYRNVSEVVTTIMFNYIAIYLASWLVHEPSPLAEPDTFFPMSRMVLTAARLPILMKGSSLHLGPLIGIAFCILASLFLKYTPFGFQTRLTGSNPEASQYAGINVKRQILIAFLIAAAFGGVAGSAEILGLKLRVYDFFVGGVGYEALAVALLAAGNPLGVIPGALFFAALKAGAASMQISTGIEAPIASVIQALCVLFVIGVGFAEYGRLEKVKEKDEEEDEEAKSYGY